MIPRRNGWGSNASGGACDCNVDAVGDGPPESAWSAWRGDGEAPAVGMVAVAGSIAGLDALCAWGERRCLGSEDPRRGARIGRIGNGHGELGLELELNLKSELDAILESELELMLDLDLVLESELGLMLELELEWMGLRGPSE